MTYNFNSDWKFIRQDIPGAEVVNFDDAQWDTVSTPHTFNDVDSFRMIIDHSGGIVPQALQAAGQYVWVEGLC